jgi:hypothetical protein
VSSIIGSNEQGHFKLCFLVLAVESKLYRQGHDSVCVYFPPICMIALGCYFLLHHAEIPIRPALYQFAFGEDNAKLVQNMWNFDVGNTGT